ncbi:MAG: 2Fe-2S iron-sulfur cluster-binding protein, partial [bacterium]|nr:2Fe-2S iron-sulfur cluster-binding protein [bacterium]
GKGQDNNADGNVSDMAKKPIEFVTIEVDGKELSVRKDRYLLWSLRDAYYDVPYFCAHKWLDPPFSGCRQCMVAIEVGGKMMPKLQTSCSMLPAEGMRVFTQSSEVLQARKEQLEFHLLNHPLECPTCDKGGECMLQDQTMDHGLATGRYIEEKRLRPDAVMNDYILMNYKRCIHCKRCIHFGENIDGSHLLKFIDRGANTWIESFPTPGEAPRFTGNVIDICPVGALTARNYRFMGRPWEQEPSASVGSLDSVGANIWLCARMGEMARIIPRDNDEVEFGLIDDVTRFHWECMNTHDATRAHIRDGEGARALGPGSGSAEAARLLSGVIGEHGPGSVGVIGGSGLNTEELFALRRFATRDLGTTHYHLGEELFGADGPTPAVLHSLWHDKGTIEQIVNGSTVISIGCDLFEEAPSLGLRVDIQARRGLTRLVSVRSHSSEADRFAAGTLSYGYGNVLREIRALTNGLTGKGETIEALAGAVETLRLIGDDCAIVYGSEVWRSGNPNEVIEALGALRLAIAAANPVSKGVYLNAVFPAVNSVGALIVNNLELFPGSMGDGKPPVGSLRKVLEAAATGKLRALLVANYDLLSLYPDRDLVERALRGAGNLIYIGSFSNPTSERAGLHLPLGTYAHKDGTVVSMEWRVQRRTPAALVNVAPDLLHVLNTIAAEMLLAPISANIYDLHEEMQTALPCYPKGALRSFNHTGVFMEISQLGSAVANTATELPVELKATPEFPLVVVPKRFLYNDREEIRHSPVFDKVPKPYFAYLNPTDMKVQNLSAGDMVELQGGATTAQLAIHPASWVRLGSVVINDYNLAVPANGIASSEATRVRIERMRSGSGITAAAAAASRTQLQADATSGEATKNVQPTEAAS